MDPLQAVTAGTGVMFLMNLVANTKAVNLANHPAEDSKIGVDDAARAAFAERVKAQGGVDRWSRVAANQFENFGPALAVFWAGLIFNFSDDKTVVMYCFLAYLGFRILFVICYLFSLQPWRSIVFILSQISVLAASYPIFKSGFNLGMFAVVIMFLMNNVARMKSIDPNNHPAEDKALGVTEEAKGAYKRMVEEQGINRWHRIAANQGEQFPIALLILVSSIFVRDDGLPLNCLLCYLGFRILFVVCYLLKLSPWRSLFFIGGNVSVIVSASLSISALNNGKPDTDHQQLTASVCNLVMFIMYNVALIKAINPEDHPAEDASLGINEDAKAAFKKRVEEQGGVDRWTRIALNQVENFPLALNVLWATVYSGGHYTQYCFGGYLVARVLFVICYLLKLQPWRSISYLLANVAVLSAIVLGIQAVTGTDSAFSVFIGNTEGGFECGAGCMGRPGNSTVVF